MTPTITPAELRDSFDRAPALRFKGISFAEAMATPLIRLGLHCAAVGRRLNAATRGEPLPTQLNLLEPTP